VNVLFVNYHDFSSNSAIHIFNLANRLVDLGDDCCVCVPGDPATVELVGAPLFSTASVDEGPAPGRFRNGEGPALVHAWTPRENVRRFVDTVVGRFRIPYVVHLEDNEDAIAAGQLNVDVDELRLLDERTFAQLPETVSHPRRSREFLRAAAAVTVVTPRLVDLVPSGISVAEIRPAFEPELFVPLPPNEQLKAQLGLALEYFFLF
jgi:hypothetical protein